MHESSRCQSTERTTVQWLQHALRTPVQHAGLQLHRDCSIGFSRDKERETEYMLGELLDSVKVWFGNGVSQGIGAPSSFSLPRGAFT